MNQMTSEKYLNFFLLMAFENFSILTLQTRDLKNRLSHCLVISFNIWQYWKNVASHLHICSGGFTQVRALWPVGLLVFLFSQKTGFDISCKLFQMEIVYMKCQNLFPGKNQWKKNVCHLLKILPRVLSVKLGVTKMYYNVWAASEYAVCSVYLNCLYIRHIGFLLVLRAAYKNI